MAFSPHHSYAIVYSAIICSVRRTASISWQVQKETAKNTLQRTRSYVYTKQLNVRVGVILLKRQQEKAKCDEQ